MVVSRATVFLSVLVTTLALTGAWTTSGEPLRPAWTQSGFHGTAETPPPFATEQVYPEARFTNPLSLVYHEASDHFFALQLDGKLFAFPKESDGQSQLVLDLAKALPGVRRGYGIAFEPNFDEAPYIYLCYIYENKRPDGTVVSRFRLEHDPQQGFQIDLNSKLELIRWRSGGHNGGCLKFGPDGYFYISTGDSEVPSPPDPLHTGQDLSDLLAAILRIDVRNATQAEPYRIPPDNPFVNTQGARPEIWAYGLRNPWRMSFDRETGDLWVGDVGWELWEMIYRVERGGNYGWSITEGRQPVYPNDPKGPTPRLDPIAEHPHSEARSITGGFVSHSSRLPALQSRYLYGDYVTGRVWSLPQDAAPLSEPELVAETPIQIICFGQDDAGEVYAVDYVSGTIHRFIDNPERGRSSTFPQRLSKSGLFRDVSQHKLAAGVLPYQIQTEPWEDGATAQRFVAIPNQEQLGRYQRNRFQQGEIKDEWAFPEGSILGKTLSPPGSNQRIETQILHRYRAKWRAYSYLWNADQTDAQLVGPDGMTVERPTGHPPPAADAQKWKVASRTECILCHTIQAGNILGFNERQLAEPGVPADRDQLARFAEQGLFQQPPQRTRRAFVPPHDPTHALDDRARSYLHVNCAHCHRFGGGGTAIFDLRYELDNTATKLFASLPIQGTFGIAGAQVIAPQDPSASLLYYRMAKLGQGRMPHFGAREVDTAGLELLRSWIQAMPSELSLKPDETEVTSLRAQQQHSLHAFRRQNHPSSATADAHLASLLQTPSGGLEALAAVQAGTTELPAAHRSALIAAASQHSDARTRDLFLRFVPPEARAPRLGLSVDPEPILSLTGDPERGEAYLREATQLRCLECHALGDSGREFGPRLDGVGTRLSRDAILTSLLEPSASIAPEYAAHTIETRDGDIFTGFILSRSEAGIVFRDLQQAQINLSREEVQSMDSQSLSLMPQFLLQDLTPQAVADLLSFLTGLK